MRIDQRPSVDSRSTRPGVAILRFIHADHVNPKLTVSDFALNNLVCGSTGEGLKVGRKGNIVVTGVCV